MALPEERICSRCGEAKHYHSEEVEGGQSMGWFCNTPQCLIHTILKTRMRHARFYVDQIRRLEAIRPVLAEIIQAQDDQEANPGSTDEE